jgi:hypothetical protein
LSYYLDPIYKVSANAALSKNVNFGLNFSRIYCFSGVSLFFADPPLSLNTNQKFHEIHHRWLENQWSASLSFNYPLTKHLYLISDAELMLFLHNTNFENKKPSSLDNLIQVRYKSLQSQSYGLNATLGLEARLIKPLSLFSSWGYVHSFKDKIYQVTGTIQSLDQLYSIDKTFLMRFSTFNLGLKYNLGYFYHKDKECWWW